MDFAFRCRPPSPWRIASVVGTRPEAIKMAPVLRALARKKFRQQLVLTGQHPLLAPEVADVDTLELDLPLGCLNVGEHCLRIRDGIIEHLAADPPDLVFVQGDTTSALAGALAAKMLGVPLGHVEAGLRSFDLDQPWPEEGNRIAIDRASDLLFAPTPTSARNLAADPAIGGWIYITGNTGIDALFDVCAGLGPAAEQGARKLILATCHRRENQGAGIVSICSGLRRAAAELPVEIVVPLHPNPAVANAIEAQLAGAPHVTLLPPVDHADMVRLMLASWLIVTDSGGLQEEAPALGRALLVLRNVTERPEAAASMELIGTDGDAIFTAIARLLAEPERHASMSRPAFPFGDGFAARRIADAAETYLLACHSHIRDEPGHGARLEIRELA